MRHAQIEVMPLTVGSRCFIKPSTSVKRASLHRGIVTGALEMRDYYDDFGELQGQRLAYKVSVNGEEFCAPPDMLVPR